MKISLLLKILATMQNVCTEKRPNFAPAADNGEVAGPVRFRVFLCVRLNETKTQKESVCV